MTTSPMIPAHCCYIDSLSKAEQRAVLSEYLHERKYRQLMRTEK